MSKDNDNGDDDWPFDSSPEVERWTGCIVIALLVALAVYAIFHKIMN